MKSGVGSFILLFVMSASIISCTEDEKPSIIGTWQGTQLKTEVYTAGIPLPIYSETDDTFNTVLEFNDDGTIIITDDGVKTSGTWEYTDGNKKIIAAVDFQNDLLDPSETLTIKEITGSTLTLYIEKSGTYEFPDVGELTGTVKATFLFSRVN